MLWHPALLPHADCHMLAVVWRVRGGCVAVTVRDSGLLGDNLLVGHVQD